MKNEKTASAKPAAKTPTNTKESRKKNTPNDEDPQSQYEEKDES